MLTWIEENRTKTSLKDRLPSALGVYPGNSVNWQDLGLDPLPNTNQGRRRSKSYS
ncbi:hypothetical protein [Mycoplasma sp. ATU-Cv-508]|uniref:hypothetical protein n=1 Tax=Mycoplasma sp. ATU-Cv-508 TaxID=2048001 RepID=UPI001374FF70